jgi:hypothetical protein
MAKISQIFNISSTLDLKLWNSFHKILIIENFPTISKVGPNF